MFDSLTELIGAMTWRGFLIGALIFVGTFFINLAIVSFIMVKIPADYFKEDRHVSCCLTSLG